MNLRQPVIAKHTIALLIVFLGISAFRVAHPKNEFKTIPIVLFGQKDITENIQWATAEKTHTNSPPSAVVLENPVDRLILCWDFMTPTQRQLALQTLGLPKTTTYRELFSLPRPTPSWQNRTCGFPA